MSITHAQLRQFASAIDSEGLLRSWQLSHATKNTLTRCGLVDGAYITPAGRDAIATVPYLVDATPVEEAPATPETVECSACDGQGVKRVAHVYELRDYSTGKLTQHTRGTLVVCDAKGCERGRVAAKPATSLITSEIAEAIKSAFVRYCTDAPLVRPILPSDRVAPPVITICKPFDYSHEEIVTYNVMMKKHISWPT